MNAFLSKPFSANPKPVLSHAEGSAIQNRKWRGSVKRAGAREQSDSMTTVNKQ
jgi:hypothetical protein